MSYYDHCEECGIMLEPDFDDEDGTVCAQCKKRKMRWISPSDKVLLNTQLISLTQGDVDVLDGSKNRKVRIDPYEDKEVKALYAIWKSL